MITFIVPAFKKPLSLERLLDSLHQNTHKRYSHVVVVIDDGSDKATMQRKFPWCQVISTNRIGSGAVGAIWCGYYAAASAGMDDGDIVGVLGDDCEIVTDGIDELMMEAAEGHCRPTYVLGLNDGIQAGRAHPFMSVDSWRNGLGFWRGYRHNYCDTETFTLARHYNDWVFVQNGTILHHHEYAKKKGIQVDIIEETQAEGRTIAQHDAKRYQYRMAWWEVNGKPRMIPEDVGYIQ